MASPSPSSWRHRPGATPGGQHRPLSRRRSGSISWSWLQGHRRDPPGGASGRWPAAAGRGSRANDLAHRARVRRRGRRAAGDEPQLSTSQCPWPSTSPRPRRPADQIGVRTAALARPFVLPPGTRRGGQVWQELPGDAEGPSVPRGEEAKLTLDPVTGDELEKMVGALHRTPQSVRSVLYNQRITLRAAGGRVTAPASQRPRPRTLSRYRVVKPARGLYSHARFWDPGPEVHLLVSRISPSLGSDLAEPACLATSCVDHEVDDTNTVALRCASPTARGPASGTRALARTRQQSPAAGVLQEIMSPGAVGCPRPGPRDRSAGDGKTGRMGVPVMPNGISDAHGCGRPLQRGGAVERESGAVHGPPLRVDRRLSRSNS